MTALDDYQQFVLRKSQHGTGSGFEPLWIPESMYPFQRDLTEWSIRQGRGAIFADCGLGKTLMQLVWADNVVRKTGKRVLIMTPLAVAGQTAAEAEKFGIEARVSHDGTVDSGITITNYEKLHLFDSNHVTAAVCDESSILKAYGGKRRKYITRFLSKLPYRLLCTATAAPNDYVELGTSSEALGELSHSEMLKRFFRQLDDKGQKREQKLQDEAESLIESDPSYFQKLAYRVSQTIGQWRLRHHAVDHFWRWVAYWARACRKPSDIGYSDDDFRLPELHENVHVIEAGPPPGHLFAMPSLGLREERSERRRTLNERTEYVAELVSHKRPAVVWCHMNPEGDALESRIADAEQIAGRTPDERKVELYEAFASGELRVLVIKPKIGAWGLNWQHCSDVVTFPSHSFEQHYQSVRRCWRFGQKNDVRLHVVATEGEVRVLGNLKKKEQKAEVMFEKLVTHMNDAQKIERPNEYVDDVEVPVWL